MTDIVNFNNASPQHIRHAYADPTVSTALPGDQNRIVTVYSGDNTLTMFLQRRFV